MRKLAIGAGWLVLLPLSLVAQQTPQAELFTGYSYARMEEEDLHGWNGSIAGNINKNLAIVADFSGHYMSSEETVRGLTLEQKLRFHSFMFGPRVSEQPHPRLIPFAHALFGGSRIFVFEKIRTPTGRELSDEDTLTGFAMAVGGGLDFKASDRIAIRVAQAEYFLLRAEEIKHEGARISGGIVFRLGRKED